MQTIAMISAKGGVGKTTVTANLASVLAARGLRVLVIDLDPQNALRFHLGLDPDEIAGLSREGISTMSLFDSPFGIKFIPFGRVDDTELVELEAALKQHKGWMANALAQLPPDAFDFVLLDTPPGPSVYLQQALHAADRALVVVLADAASFATVPHILSLTKDYTATNPHFQDAHILINQMPTQGRLGQGIRSALFAQYAEKVIPVSIHRDAHVPHALAFERPVLQYEPGCRASLDMQYLADWVLGSQR